MLVLSRRVFTVFLVIGICLLTLLSKPVLSYASLVLEGQIVDNGKKLAARQMVKMTLRIYDDEFGGKLLFEEKQKVAAGSDKSLFTFEKGEVTVQKRTSGLQAESLWVEVETDGQVMTPRLSLAEIGTVANLIGSSLSLREAGLRGVGDPTMIIDNNGVTLNSSTSDSNITPNAATVFGVNSYSGSDYSFGGYFSAAGNSGKGVFGDASGSSGNGVFGMATGIGIFSIYSRR